MTEVGCWILREIRALVAVLIVFFALVVAVVLFVLPPVVASHIGDCGSKSWYFSFIRKAIELRRIKDFPGDPTPTKNQNRPISIY